MPPVKPLPLHITSLSDEELTNKLREYSLSPGPIVRTTRKVYERKLFELETGEKPAPTYDYAPVDDDEDSTDEEVQAQHQPRQRLTRTVETTEIRRPSPRKPLHPEGSDNYQLNSPSQNTKREKLSTSSTGIPLWVKILLALAIAGLVFLVIKNLETDPGSTIPEDININL